MPSIHDAVRVEEVFRASGVDPERLRLLRNVFFKRQRPSAEALEAVPGPVRKQIAEALAFHELTLLERLDSSLDGASKLILRTRQGFLVETVLLRIASGRTSLCISTQVGCAARCDFCATGRMGLARSLSPAEILDQVVLANQILAPEGRRARNIVFMGMGEPFHNEEALHAAIEVLQSPKCFAIDPGRILVSTVGIPDAMVQCARRFPRVNQALSLHGARGEIRRRLIPLAAVHELPSLRRALEEVSALLHRPVMIEHLLLEGLTDTEEDIAALVEFLAGLRVHINLIPFNPIEDAPELRGTGRERREAFAASLREAGFKVTLRYSLGSDISAACGQLVRGENLEVARARRRVEQGPNSPAAAGGASRIQGEDPIP